MPRLILIPGLGANRLLFEPQRHHFDQDLFLPDWTPPIFTKVEGKKPVPEALADYARRLAERWKETVLAKPEVRRAYWLGGVSFGGMIALEAASYLVEEGLPPKGLFLIASTRSSAALPGGIRLGLKCLRLIGPKNAAKLRPWIRGRVIKREGLNELDERLFRRMAESVDIELVLWGAAAMLGWSCDESRAKALAAKGVRIHQVHGDNDWAIPFRPGRADKVIHGGRHLINITHAEEVNEYLTCRMKEDASED
jgi:pimeloyl-ACP methyl ester carboxylesterase